MNKYILLVDNDEGYCGSIKTLLEHHEYHMRIAATEEAATKILDTKRVDLIIIDIRLLDNNDENDVSGLLFGKKLNPTLPKIFVTAYKKPYDQIEPLPKIRFVGKTEDPRALIEAVKFMFENAITLPRGEDELEIEFSGRFGFADLVKETPDFHDYPKEVQPRIVEELEEVVRKLFPLADKIKLGYLASGRSGSGVVSVQPQFYGDVEGSALVIKFGRYASIMEEVKRYHQFVEPFVQRRSTQLISQAQATQHLAGIKFLFVGSPNEISQSFEQLWTEDPSEALIEGIIKDLFSGTGKVWYGGSRRKWRREENLAQVYEKQLSLFENKLTASLHKLLNPSHDGSNWGNQLQFEKIGNGERLRIRSFGLGNKEWELLNPLHFYKEYYKKFPKPMRESIIHGDLNARNLFVDKEDGHVWLIDFFKTGWGPALLDSAELETVAKFEFLEMHQFVSLFELEDCLIKNVDLYDPIELPRWAERNPAVKRVAQLIEHVRYHNAESSPDRSMNEYYMHLFFFALKMMTWRGFSRKDEERMLNRQCYALYSAAKLAQKIKLVLDG